MIFPFAIPLSMQFSTSTYVMLFSSLIYMKKFTYWNKKDRSLFLFMLTGIVTVYVDFLTYPIITLGIPLILGVLMTGGKIKYILQHSVMWAVGYAGMWISKWVVASLILRQNVMANGFSAVLNRMAGDTSDGKKVTMIRTIALNIGSMFHVYYIIIFISVFIFILYLLLREYKKSGTFMKDIKKQGHFLLIAFYPIAWYAMAKNHSSIHRWFTYRALLVTFFAVTVMIVRGCRESN